MKGPYRGAMADAGKPELHVNRRGDTSDPDLRGHESHRDICSCFDQSTARPHSRVGFHTELQDTSAAGRRHLLTLIDEAAADGREEFRPRCANSARRNGGISSPCRRPSPS